MQRVRRFYERVSTTKIPHEIDDGLESIDEYKKRWRSIRIIYFTMFLMSLGFSIIITGIWPFLNKLDYSAGKEFMGLVVAINPLGQMIFSPIFGWWANRLEKVRLPLLCSLAIFTLASLMYSSLELRPPHVKYWMLISRFLIGVSSANIAVCRSYLSAATRLSERTQAVSMVSLAQVLGFIFGPALQAAVTPLGSVGYTAFNKLLIINMYTASGWINVFLGIINFILFLPYYFHEYKVSAREAMILQGKATERETWESIQPDYTSVWLLIIAFGVLVFNFVLLETLGTSLTMDMFAWSNYEALYYMGILMCVGAIVALISFIAINPLCKIFPERYVLIWGGFLLMVLGRVVIIPMGGTPPKLAEVYNASIHVGIDLDDERFLGCPVTQEWCATTPVITLEQFLVGHTLTSIGYPIGITLLQTIFSKVLGPRPQGVWMGWMTGSGCLSRVLGPVFVGSIYTRFGTYWAFGITSAMMFLFMICLQFQHKRLIPPSYDGKDVDVELKDLQAKENLENEQTATILTKMSP